MKVEFATDYIEDEMWVGGFVGRNGNVEEFVQSKIENTSATGELSVLEKFKLFGNDVDYHPMANPFNLFNAPMLEDNKIVVFIVGSFAGENQGMASILNSDSSFTESESSKEYQFNGSVEYILYQWGLFHLLCEP
jgi:hypothetical protein